MSRASTHPNSPPLIRLTQAMSGKSYSDIVLAFLVVAIVGLMILPLPLLVVDILVALNMLISLGLLLLAIYIPAATAFSSFPSVILISTLFRLSLSIAITRLILMDADAGDIIDTFGNLVVGGNVVVGLVVFTIITVVQFIVIAKGAERVAEVSARFTLDAMPGKQLSIDSDLRSGMLTKEDAKQKRRMLELESQLHGSMDGAMKFVKGDAIAGIVILLVNIVGGLTIGVMQNGMSLGDAAHTYTILTVGDGLVSQIPALLTSISAGLIITRSSQDEGHLGESISAQVSAYPKVILLGGILAFILACIPGFPWPVFVVMGFILLAVSAFHYFPNQLGKMRFGNQPLNLKDSHTESPEDEHGPRAHLVIQLPEALRGSLDVGLLRDRLKRITGDIDKQYGIALPPTKVSYTDPQADVAPQGTPPPQHAARILAYDARLSTIPLSGEANPLESLCQGFREALLHNLGLFMGIQETANLVNQWNDQYPDLIKEALRSITPLRMSEVLRGLLEERIPVNNLRTIFECFTAQAPQEKDTEILIEKVRVSLKRQISEQFASTSGELPALLVNPEFEHHLREVFSDRSPNSQDKLQDLIQHFQTSLAEQLSAVSPATKGNVPYVVLAGSDVRRFIRQFTMKQHPTLAVLAFQELTDNLNIHSLGQIA